MSHTLQDTSAAASVPDQSKLSAGFLQRTGVRQFAKFCIVGVSSTAISFAIFNILYHVYTTPLVVALTAAFFLSVLNGFFWNRKWTFKNARKHSARRQSVKFLLVNLVGWFLNTTIVVLIIAHYTRTGGGVFGPPDQFRAVVFSIVAGEGRHYGPVLSNLALAAATCVVVFWNYFANRTWTFKH